MDLEGDTCLSVNVQSSEMMCPPVKQLHSRAKSLVAEFNHGGGSSYIDEAIDLDRKTLELCPPGDPM